MSVTFSDCEGIFRTVAIINVHWSCIVMCWLPWDIPTSHLTWVCSCLLLLSLQLEGSHMVQATKNGSEHATYLVSDLSGNDAVNVLLPVSTITKCVMSFLVDCLLCMTGNF